MQVGKPFRFHTPSSILVVGLSGCGKTVFTEKLLLENRDFFETLPTQMHYCYGVWQDRFQPMQDRRVVFHEGIPDHSTLVQWFPPGGKGVMVLDDLMDEGSHSPNIPIIKTSRSFTCVKTCFPWANMPKAFPAMLITSWLSRTRGINWESATVASIVSYHVERQFGDLSSGHNPSLWVFGVRFTPRLVRSTTIVESPVKRRRMDAHLSKTS